ncbi:hypothetical protein C7B80_26665 [Cyanosarcina cf. burmensis CCALA 770]|nr:hypothetical protein C7B80_26665 [Cyanosarcina cf. burmensis CCALA 770]
MVKEALTMTDADVHPISELRERYKLNSKQAVYDRIDALGFKPVARGKISSDQLEILDRLDKHIKAGGAIADFPIIPEVEVPALDKLDRPLDNPQELVTDDARATIEGLAALVGAIAQSLQPPQPPLAAYEDLEKAVERGWILPTSKVKELIGISPRTKKGDKYFQWGSFTFVKVGKLGAETGWQVGRN